MSNIRKFDTKVQHLKYKVLREVAREAWNDTLLENLIDIPKKIVPGKTSTMRCCVYKERAILAERVKIAMGGDHENSNVIQVIDIACDECPAAGYEVTEACDGQQALMLYNEKEGDFDVVLLDIMMPNVDGLEVCKRLRTVSGTVGIIMLTAKSQEMDKISGLMLGADDYITKPFSPTELLARVDRLYCRVEMQNGKGAGLSSEITLGDFALDLRRRALSKAGKHIDLTQVEFQIVEYLFSTAGQPVDRLDILKRVWGESFIGEEKIVDVNIRRLRMKIEDDPSEPRYIVTVWGRGYKWNSNI